MKTVPALISKLHETKRLNSISLLLLSTFLSCAVLLVRIFYTQNLTFLFFIWNIFLAWLPYSFALLLNSWDRPRQSLPIAVLLLASWLVFFPNALYIVTDLFHLKSRQGIPLWYDLMLIFSFAWTGVLLGFLSLMEVQSFLISRLNNPRTAWLFVAAALLLGSFGIYLGRYERWNSWEIITNPLALIESIIDKVIHPAANKEAVLMTFGWAAFWILAYLTFWFISQNFSHLHQNSKSVGSV